MHTYIDHNKKLTQIKTIGFSLHLDRLSLHCSLMPKNFLLHTILLIASVSGVYLWLITPFLVPYTLQLVGLLILIFAFTHWGRSKLKAKPRRRNTIPLDLSLLVTAVLLLVTETGSLTSPLFFLLYFLLFTVSMLYEIEATLVLTGSLLIYFLLLPSTNLSDLMHLGQLFGLVMITPLALFTGHEYEELVSGHEREAGLLKSLGETESDTLVFLSTNLKTTLISSLDKLNTLIPLARARDLKENLGTLYQDLKNLYRSADELERVIDKKTD